MAIHKRSIDIIKYLIFLSLILSISGADSDVFDEACTTDTDCAPPFFICSDSNKCKHKDLLVPRWEELVCIAILSVLLMLSSAAGIGGGSIVVPLTIILIKFTTKQAVAISSGIVVLNSLTIYLLSIFKKHPTIPDKTLIDYNLALSMVAPMMVGSLLGSIIAVIIPSVIQLILLAMIIVLSIFKSISNTKKLWKKENEEIAAREKKSRYGDSNDNQLPEYKVREQSECPVNSSVFKKLELQALNKKKEQKIDSLPEFKVGEESECIVNPTSSNMLKKTGDEIEQGVERIVVAKENVVESHELNRLKSIDKQNFNLIKTVIPIIIVLLALALVFLRGGKGVDSIVGITKCSIPDWGLVAAYSLLNILLFIICAYIISKEQDRKKACGWVYRKGEVSLGIKEVLNISIISFFVGLIGSLTGIGGGLIYTPILLGLGYGPKVIHGTGMYLVFLNKIISVVVYFSSGLLPLDYLFVLGTISVVLVIIAIWRLDILIKKLGRQSIISMIFIIIVTFALGLTIYAGTVSILGTTGNFMEFKSLCD